MVLKVDGMIFFMDVLKVFVMLEYVWGFTSVLEHYNRDENYIKNGDTTNLCNESLENLCLTQ